MDGNGRKRDSTRENPDDREPNGHFRPGNKVGRLGGRPEGSHDFGVMLRAIGSEKASKFGWSKKIAERMGLDPDEYTVLDIIAHSSMEHGCEFGRAPYFQEIVQRMFGKVPDRIEADINLGLTDEQKVRAQRIADLADAVE